MIANESGYSPLEQFQVLHSKSQFCIAPTRALLLSTYIKWVNVFPEIKDQLVNVFDRYRHVLDVDLQQRACEYYTLASRPDDDELLQNVCEEIPPFPPRESALLGRLNKKHSDTEGDKRTWIHGGKEANLDREATRRGTRKLTLGNIKGNGTADGVSPAASPASGDATTDTINSLLGLDLATSPSSATASAFPDIQSAPAAALAEAGIPRLTVNANVDRWFEKLMYSAEGVLYEDVQIQIGIKSRYHGHIGQLAVYIGNKVSAPLTSFTATLHNEEPENVSVSFAKIAPSTLAPRQQTQQLIHVECKKPFTKSPILSVSFLAGAHQSIAVRLPLSIAKFIEHVKLGQADFFERWKLIGGPPRESQSIFPIKLDEAGHVDLARQRQIVSGYALNVLDEVDPNPNNIVAAGILHMSEDGKVGCLMRLEPNREAKVSHLLPVFYACH